MLPRFFASYYLRRDRYTDTELSSPRGPSSRRKTTRSRDRRSVSKGLRGNALTSLLPTTRLTHVVPALPAPKLSAIVAYRSVDSFSPPFSFPSPTLSSSPSLLSFTLLFLYLLLFLFHNVNIILWTRVYRYVRVVECLHVPGRNSKPVTWRSEDNTGVRAKLVHFRFEILIVYLRLDFFFKKSFSVCFLPIIIFNRLDKWKN